MNLPQIFFSRGIYKYVVTRWCEQIKTSLIAHPAGMVTVGPKQGESEMKFKWVHGKTVRITSGRWIYVMLADMHNRPVPQN